MKVLNEYELRVLGALVEKQISTPDYYPITLNGLTNACNQKNHRDPVVSYAESVVESAIESLRDKNLAFLFDGAVSRVPKYGHFFPTACNLEPAEVAVLCVLMLRGPQTPGELRSRTPHLHNFESLSSVEETLRRLSAREEPLVRKLAREPGKKESRFAHLLGGDIPVEAGAETLSSEPAMPPAPADPERIAKLEAEIAALRQQFSELTAQFANFRKQFE